MRPAHRGQSLGESLEEAGAVSMSEDRQCLEARTCPRPLPVRMRLPDRRERPRPCEGAVPVRLHSPQVPATLHGLPAGPVPGQLSPDHRPGPASGTAGAEPRLLHPAGGRESAEGCAHPPPLILQ